MMKFRILLCCAALCAGLSTAHAEALLKPLPAADTSKLKPEIAQKLTQARADFEKAKAGLVGPPLALAYAEIGAVYFRAGLNDVADLAFYDAAQLEPKDARWLYMRGVIANVQNRPADARANFEAALALDQSYLPIRYRLADTLIELGDLDGAHRLLEAALTGNPEVAVLPAMLGRLELRQRRYADAVKHLQTALALEPQASALYKDLADAYTGQGDARSAQDAAAKAGPTPPSLADPIIAGIFGAPAAASSGTPLEQARALMQMRRFADARDKVGEALKEEPGNVDALAFAARLDALMGLRDDAQSEAEHALRLQPRSAAANLSQGMVYEFAGDDARARSYYQRAVEADPQQPDARLLLGNALMRHGDYLQAAEQYRGLAAVAPRNDNADARVAAALVAAGRCGEALEETNAKLAKRAQDGDLMQVFVRLTSTCSTASAQARGMALDYARELYRERPDAEDSSALALAQAANGKFDDAQKSMAEAIFAATRAGNAVLAEGYREMMRQFVAKQVPERPWPTQHPYFKPPLLTPPLANAKAK